MKNKNHTAFLIVLVVAGAFLLYVVLGFTTGVYGPFGIETKKQSVENPTSYDGAVPYQESDGKVCENGKRFLRTAGSSEIGCTCKAGYQSKQQVVGYNQCYGEGSECPILVVSCEKQ